MEETQPLTGPGLSTSPHLTLDVPIPSCFNCNATAVMTLWFGLVWLLQYFHLHRQKATVYRSLNNHPHTLGFGRNSPCVIHLPTNTLQSFKGARRLSFDLLAHPLDVPHHSPLRQRQLPLSVCQPTAVKKQGSQPKCRNITKHQRESKQNRVVP